MAVYFTTTDAQALLDDFKSDVQANRIHEWRIDAFGDLVHTPGDYPSKVYLNPVVEKGRLKLNVKFYNAAKAHEKRELFGVLSGRVIEMFIAHGWPLFSKGSFTEMPEDGDDDV